MFYGSLAALLAALGAIGFLLSSALVRKEQVAKLFYGMYFSAMIGICVAFGSRLVKLIGP